MRYTFLLVFVAAVLGGGCSSSLEVALTGAPEMNNGGNAAIVKVYQLKGNSNFRKVPVSAFWRSDAKALGGALLTEPREVTLYPSDSTTVQIKLVDKAKYVGVAANLRDPRREKWRFSHSVKDMGDQVWLTVKNREIAVRVEDKGLLDRIAGLF